MSIKIDYKGKSYELSDEMVAKFFSQKVERTATIRKNQRERADGSIKDLAKMAIDGGILEPIDAVALLTEKDTDKNRENKKELIEKLTDAGLISNEKTAEPTADDYEQALKSVLAGGGQSDF